MLISLKKDSKITSTNITLLCHKGLLVFLKGSPAGLQSQMFWGLIFLMQDPWAGKPEVGLKSLLEESLGNYNYPPACGLPTWGYGC